MSVRVYTPLRNPFADIHHAEEWDYCKYDAGATLESLFPGEKITATAGGELVNVTDTLSDGAIVYVRPVPQAAALAVAASAIATAASATGAFVAANAGLLTLTALSTLGSFLTRQKPQNAGSGSGGFDRLNSITGTSNEVAAFQPIPRLFGRMRFYPSVPMTAAQYTETVGSDQYLRVKLLLGQGPMEIGGHIVGKGYPRIDQNAKLEKYSDLNQAPIRLEETDIAEYEDIEWQIGAPDQVDIYKDQVVETSPGWATESDASGHGKHDSPTVSDGQSTTRTTDTGCVEFSIELTGNIYTVDSKGRLSKIRVEWKVEWRITGSNDAWSSATFSQQSYGKETSRATFRQGDLPNDGTQSYDIRLTRVSTYFSNLEGEPSSKVTWTALRTFKDRAAFVDPDDAVVMDMRIRATDQLNGQIDKLSVLATSVLNVYDPDSGEWSPQPTRAPAWAFVSTLTDNSNKSPIALSDFYAESFAAWAAETEQRELYYDNVLDNTGTTLTRMNEIAQAGYATWSIDSDTRVRAILDDKEPPLRDVVSPRNSWGYTYNLQEFDPPHALRVRYIDNQTWENTERVVFDDGYAEIAHDGLKAATNYETIDAPGATTPEQAWRVGRLHLANLRLRAIEKHSYNKNFKHFDYSVGDLVKLAHDVILVSLAWGRVDSVVTDDDGNVTHITTDEFLPMAQSDKDYAVTVQRLDGTADTVDIVTEYPGTHRVALKTPLRDIGADDHVIFGYSGKVTTDLKVVTVTPQDRETAQIVCEPAALNLTDAIDGEIPAPGNDVSVPGTQDLRPAAPQILGIISDRSVAISNDDGSLNYRILVSVAEQSGRAPTDHIVVQLRRNDAKKWTSVSTSNGEAFFNDIDPGEVYDIRAVAVGVNDRMSGYTYSPNYTAQGQLPSPPTSISIDRNTMALVVTPQGNPVSVEYEVYWADHDIDLVDVRDKANKAGEGRTVTINELRPGTDYWVWAAAINKFGSSDLVEAKTSTGNDPIIDTLQIYGSAVTQPAFAKDDNEFSNESSDPDYKLQYNQWKTVLHLNITPINSRIIIRVNGIYSLATQNAGSNFYVRLLRNGVELISKTIDQYNDLAGIYSLDVLDLSAPVGETVTYEQQVKMTANSYYHHTYQAITYLELKR